MLVKVASRQRYLRPSCALLEAETRPEVRPRSGKSRLMTALVVARKSAGCFQPAAAFAPEYLNLAFPWRPRTWGQIIDPFVS
jgi:hypothetical protein